MILVDYYSEILNLKEAKDFARVIKKWELLSNNLKNTTNIQMVLPDLFWVSKPGVGKTHLLRLLSEYLYSKQNLMDFKGDVKYFEFLVDYCSPTATFTEVNRLYNEIKNASGFRNSYKGILSIDIDEWLGHCEEKHFLTFLEYLSSNSDDWLIIFIVSSGSKTEISNLESVLSMYFRIEKSILSIPKSNDLLDFVITKLSGYDLTLSEDAKNLLLETINKLRENKYFDGYKTLVMLCQDIVYEFFSVKKLDDNVITADHLVEFAPDSKYIERATWKAEKKNRIGFIN